jgi:hypothetical protein
MSPEPRYQREAFVTTVVLVRGACIALPRGTGLPGTLLGIICQSATTGQACFWDNKRADDPNQRPVGWANLRLSIADLADGSNLQDNCTNCHRGNNVFLIPPDDQTWAKLLRGPLDGPRTGTFITKVEASSDKDQMGRPRYIPIAKLGWTNPPGNVDGACGLCHENQSSPFLPSPMPPSCGFNCDGHP